MQLIQNNSKYILKILSVPRLRCVETSNPEYKERTKSWMEEKFIGECRKIIENGTAVGSAFEPDAHATYIVDLACAIAEIHRKDSY